MLIFSGVVVFIASIASYVSCFDVRVLDKVNIPLEVFSPENTSGHKQSFRS